MRKYPYYIPANKVYKPWIPVSIGYKKTHKITTPITALIDSGADVCFCSKEIATFLGIQEKGKKNNFYCCKWYCAFYFYGNNNTVCWG